MWRDTAAMPEYGRLEGDVRTDVLVIGGGMAGILCAHFLRQAGVDCVLAEADRLCAGATGKTTAKITSQHGLVYDRLLRRFGAEKAGMYLHANEAALARYRKTWLSMLTKYPLTYAEAFFAGNVSYYTFAPKLEGETYNQQAGNRLVFETYDLGEDPRFLHTEQIAALEGARTLLAVFARGIRHIPLLALLYACATYTWLLAGAALIPAPARSHV